MEVLQARQEEEKIETSWTDGSWSNGPTTTNGEHGKGENDGSWKTQTKFHARKQGTQPTTCTNAKIKWRYGEESVELETIAVAQSEPTTASSKARILW